MHYEIVDTVKVNPELVEQLEKDYFNGRILFSDLIFPRLKREFEEMFRNGKIRINEAIQYELEYDVVFDVWIDEKHYTMCTLYRKLN
jgi:hypothetical protein